MNIRRPSASKADVLAKYEAHSCASEEHRQMMWFSPQTWENRLDEAARLISWPHVRTWLDVGCGTARLFEKVISRPDASSLERCVGIDAIENNLGTARRKAWPRRPEVRLLRRDIEDLDNLGEGPFDLVTMVGVVYQCGLAPAIAVEKCVRQLPSSGLLLVTTENAMFKRLVADPHGCYPPRVEFEDMFRVASRVPSSVTVQYTNPLWSQRITGISEDESAEYKETFFLVFYGDGDHAD